MFWENFYFLCTDAEMKPLQVVKKIGISHGSITKWKQGAVPSGASLQKIADFFNVSVDYLLGKEEKPLPLGRIIEREEDELWAKITRLDETDRIKMEAYADGLLASEKYQEPTHLVKIAARAGGGIREVALTESQIEALKNLPEVPNLDDKKDKK